MIDGLINFVQYFGFSLTLMALFTFLYVKTTPYNEAELIFKEGNEAAAMALVGSIIGFILPIASVMIHAVSWGDFAIWALVAAVVQLSIALLITRGVKSFAQLIRNDVKAAGVFLAGIHISVGLLNAASMSY